MRKKPLIAYFCMEFALDSYYRIYSGGLGVLAGDIVYQASEKNDLDLIGVGLAYHYTFRQKFDTNGWQNEEEVLMDPSKDGFTKVKNGQGKILEVKINLPDRKLKVQAWSKIIKGKSRIILLDTKTEGNSSDDQEITDRLYVGSKEHRLLQEIVLGIGGVKILKKMGLRPDVYHMNEGHSAFLTLALMAEKNEPKIVFTNHTLVMAGRDVFPVELVSTYLFKYAQEIGISVDKIVNFGKIKGSSLFSMNIMALRQAKKINAVSRFHAQKAKEIWPDYNFIPITNGIYEKRWLSSNKKQAAAPKELWQAHERDRSELRKLIEKKTGKKVEANGLVLSWARRFVKYKRPLSLFGDQAKLAELIKNSPIPLYFVFAGKVHPQNEPGKQMLAEVIGLSRKPEFSGKIMVIPDYDVEVAKYLVRGSDVWLNTPMEGYEACGTSGMKAGLNGVLQCSTNDGWLREIDWQGIGWLLDNEKISESLYRTIAREIVPAFKLKDEQGYPFAWAERMFKTKKLIEAKFLTSRVIDDYQKKLYSD